LISTIRSALGLALFTFNQTHGEDMKRFWDRLRYVAGYAVGYCVGLWDSVQLDRRFLRTQPEPFRKTILYGPLCSVLLFFSLLPFGAGWALLTSFFALLATAAVAGQTVDIDAFFRTSEEIRRENLLKMKALEELSSKFDALNKDMDQITKEHQHKNDK
jgi:hypothetical protein